MYNQEYVKKTVYGFGRMVENNGSGRLSELVSINACNDNQVLSMLFKLSLRETGSVPTIEELMQKKDSYPLEVQNVLASLRTQYPGTSVFKDDESAFKFIRSRYQQFGEEVNLWVDYLGQIMKDEQSNIEASKAASSSPSSSSDPLVE